jgi:hypothetical protein
MLYGLEVYSSNLIVINVNDKFMNMASTFLSCRVGSFRFKFLGIPVSANSHLKSTWLPMVEDSDTNCKRGRAISYGSIFHRFGHGDGNFL